MKKVTFRVPVKEDGSFDLAAQRSLAAEYMAIQDAVEDAKTNLEQIAEFKPRADLPKEAVDLGDREDIADAKVAQERVAKIKRNPRLLISGSELKARLDALH